MGRSGIMASVFWRTVSSTIPIGVSYRLTVPATVALITAELIGITRVALSPGEGKLSVNFHPIMFSVVPNLDEFLAFAEGSRRRGVLPHGVIFKEGTASSAQELLVQRVGVGQCLGVLGQMLVSFLVGSSRVRAPLR